MEFRYLYRDGGNYKKHASVVFPNPEDLSTVEVSRRINEALQPDGLFMAGQARIPEVFLYEGDRFSQDDHCYHEFSGVDATDRAASDTQGRSIGRFIGEITHEAKLGWKEFDPYDSKGSYGRLLSDAMNNS
jgi:hypothetical protein